MLIVLTIGLGIMFMAALGVILVLALRERRIRKSFDAAEKALAATAADNAAVIVAVKEAITGSPSPEMALDEARKVLGI